MDNLSCKKVNVSVDLQFAINKLLFSLVEYLSEIKIALHRMMTNEQNSFFAGSFGL